MEELSEEVTLVIKALEYVESMFRLRKCADVYFISCNLRFIGLEDITRIDAETFARKMDISVGRAEKILERLWKRKDVLLIFYSPYTKYFYQIYFTPRDTIEVRFSLVCAEPLLTGNEVVEQ